MCCRTAAAAAAAAVGAAGTLILRLSSQRMQLILHGHGVLSGEHDVADLGRLLGCVIGGCQATVFEAVCVVDRWVQHAAAQGESTGAFPAQHMLRVILREHPGATAGVLDVLCCLLGPSSSWPQTDEAWSALFEVALAKGDQADLPAPGEDEWVAASHQELRRQRGLLKQDVFRFMHGVGGRTLDLAGCHPGSFYTSDLAEGAEQAEVWREEEDAALGQENSDDSCRGWEPEEEQEDGGGSNDDGNDVGDDSDELALGGSDSGCSTCDEGAPQPVLMSVLDVLAGMPEADRHDEQQVHDLLDMLQRCGIGVSK